MNASALAACNSTVGIASNLTAANISCEPPLMLEPSDPFAEFIKYAFGSAIYMMIVSFITILANSLLLLVFFVDPFKTFKTPTSYFLVGLAIGDLLTALIQEPIFAACFTMLYFQAPPAGLELCGNTLLNIGALQSAITVTVSFLIILVFTFTQIIVVSSPLKYARAVTSKKVMICVSLLYLYSTLYWMSRYWGFTDELQYKIDVFLHTLFVPYFTVILYILLHRKFQRKMKLSKALSNESRVQREQSKAKSNQIERKFIAVNFLLLAVLLLCSQPSAMFWLAKEFWLHEFTPELLIVNLMIDNILYLKFMLDPFVYAWRLPKYRQALGAVCPFLKKLKMKRQSSYENRISVSISQSKESVMTLDMRRLDCE